MSKGTAAFAAMFALLLGACSDDSAEPDAGMPPGVDAGAPDTGAPGADAGPGGEDAGPGDVDAGPAEVDAGPAGVDAGPEARSIPDPGAGMDRWTVDGLEIGPGHGSPETAFQVGTATRNPFYIGATLDPVTGDAFWVFRTGPGLTTFQVQLFGDGVDGVDFVHLHDGAGGVFGAEIPSTGFEMMPFSITASWNVMPDHVYVLEVHGSMGTFF